MKEYERLYSTLNTPATGLNIIRGKIKLPPYDTSQPAKKEYGFPPAFIPWWSSSSIPHYFGYWIHFLNPLRKLTFVQLSTNIGLGGPYHAFEIARNFNQFLVGTVFAYICVFEELDDEVREFAKAAGVKKPDELLKIIMENDSTPRGLRSHPLFKAETPLACFNEDEIESYQLDFPHNKMELNPEAARQICTVEIYDTLQERIVKMKNSPEWFSTSSQKKTFESLMKKNDHAGAWMCLNSRGWLYKEARKALESLALAVRDPVLDLLAEAWVKIPHEGYEKGY